MSYLLFSTKIANFLVKKTNIPSDKGEVLAYAVEVLGLNLLNFGMSLLIGYIFGVMPGTILCLFTVFAIRVFAGGAHSDSAWRCAFITAIIFPVLALLANKTALFMNSSSMGLFMTLAFLISLLVLFLMAPVDSHNAPIVSTARRNSLKKLSLVSLTIICTGAVLMWYFIPSSIEWQLCIVFGVLWSSFILTPIGHSFFKAFDRLKKPVRREV